jgi:hypothetical protein
VAKPLPYPDEFASHAREPESRVLVSMTHFTLLRLRGSSAEAEALASRDRWAIPLEGSIASAGLAAQAGECLFLPAGEPLDVPEDALLLLAAAGPLA